MTKRHSDDTINAAIFAADQAREVLCFLLQSPLARQPESALFMKCFEALGELQERADGNHQPGSKQWECERASTPSIGRFS